MEICTKSLHLRITDISTLLCVLIWTHDIILHLLRPSLISFNSFYNFLRKGLLHLALLAQAAIIKCRRLSGLTEMLFSVLEALSPRSGCQHGWILELFLAWKWWPFCCVLTWQTKSSSVFLYGYQFCWITALSLWPHLTLITPLKGLISNTVMLLGGFGG